jgi:hypothetical protein
MINWEIHGLEFGNCNCSYGCPCQFNALPTHGHCRAIAFFRIDRGHFGDVRLDGLKCGIAVKWPGAVHEGKGAMQPFIDETADDAQRKALFSIMTGKETKDAATFFWIYSAMCDTIHDPVYTRIDIDADMSARVATCKAVGVATGRGEPILNPVTGAQHRVGIVMPNGFEYTMNEVGRGWSHSTGEVEIELDNSYAHWCELHMNNDGLIRERRATVAA